MPTQIQSNAIFLAHIPCHAKQNPIIPYPKYKEILNPGHKNGKRIKINIMCSKISKLKNPINPTPIPNPSSQSKLSKPKKPKSKLLSKRKSYVQQYCFPFLGSRGRPPTKVPQSAWCLWASQASERKRVPEAERIRKSHQTRTAGKAPEIPLDIPHEKGGNVPRREPTA